MADAMGKQSRHQEHDNNGLFDARFLFGLKPYHGGELHQADEEKAR
jgi:hypothetical protein